MKNEAILLNLARSMRLLAAISCLVVVGCGPSGPRTVPVTGAATFSGQPIASGTVTFQALAASDLPSPVGTIANGQYSLSTGSSPGAPVGKYKVVVTASVPSNPSDPYSLPKSLIPAKYTDAGTTDVQIEIVAAPAAGAYDLKLNP
jgi:hypothetical protein